MNSHLIFNKIQISPLRSGLGVPLSVRPISIIHYKSRSSDLQPADVQVDLEEQSVQDKELEIERLRNKSKLKPEHRKIVLNERPFADSLQEYHLTSRYNRKMFGKYGSSSGVNPGLLWPTKGEIEERKEYEKVAHPFSIQELVRFAQNEIKDQDLLEQKQHDRVVANMAKLEVWKKEIKERIAKKEAEALAAREKKEKLIEEVRRHFGFTVNPKDEKFKEMLAIKEKEQRKKDKQAKNEERERKAISKLMTKHEMSFPETENNNKAVIDEK